LSIRVIFHREAEVSQFDYNLVWVQIARHLTEDVLRLQITMHDVLAMHKVQGEKHLMDDAASTLLCEAIALLRRELFQ